MKPYYRDAILHDVCELAPNLALADTREVAIFGQNPEQALTIGYISSVYCKSIIDSYSNVVAMYGVVRVDEIVGRIWMLGSTKLQKVSRPFLRENKVEIDRINKIFPHLCNVIDSRNDVHIRWVKWCGFKIIGETMINGYKFYEFSRIRCH